MTITRKDAQDIINAFYDYDLVVFNIRLRKENKAKTRELATKFVETFNSILTKNRKSRKAGTSRLSK